MSVNPEMYLEENAISVKKIVMVDSFYFVRNPSLHCRTDHLSNLVINGRKNRYKSQEGNPASLSPRRHNHDSQSTELSSSFEAWMAKMDNEGLLKREELEERSRMLRLLNEL